jgi:hypothetical protein
MKTNNLSHDETSSNNSNENNWPPDYSTYRQYLERNLRTLLISPITFLKRLITFPKIFKDPSVHILFKIALLVSMGVGILSVFWTFPRFDFLEYSFCFNIVFIVFSFAFFAYIGFFACLAVITLPWTIRLILKPYPWRLSFIYFLWFYTPYLIFLAITFYRIKLDPMFYSVVKPNQIVSLLLLPAFVPLLFSVFMGFSSAIIRLDRKLIARLLIISYLLTTVLCLFFTLISYSMLSLPLTFSKEDLVYSLFLIFPLGAFVFWAGWMLIAVWRIKLQEQFMTIWDKRILYIQNIMTRLNELRVQIQGIQISKTYFYSWGILIIFTILTLLANINPKQLDQLVWINFYMLITVVPIFLIVSTFQYIFVPQELASVKINAPPYIAKSVLRAIFILFLLFILWWTYHSALMMNINNLSIIMDNGSAYQFINGQAKAPMFGDFLFFIFAIMTNSGYLDLQPTFFLAKIHLMTVTVTGLILLVVFIAVALSQPENIPEKNEHEKTL